MVSLNPFTWTKKGPRKKRPISNSVKVNLGKSIYIDKFYKKERVAKNKKIEEDFKGEIERNPIKFPKELGEAHPFDYKLTVGLYKKFAFVTAVIDKYVDFIVGPGWFVECEDERAKKIVEDFLREINFDSLLRDWIKEALLKGTGYLELAHNERSKSIDEVKVLNADYMYVARDEKGKIKGYNQYTKSLRKYSERGKSDVTPFEPQEIAYLPINRIGDGAYGIGIVYSCLQYINDLIGYNKDMKMLMHRKANAPIHAKLGDREKGIIPEDSELSAFGKSLEYMENRHEWTTNPYVDLKVIDFGRIGEKFQFAMKHSVNMLFAGFQMPPILMGYPEGTNRATSETVLEAFQRRVQSIQVEVEKVTEKQIFRPILEANGFKVHVEMQWGLPSDKEKNERLDRIKEFLKSPFLSVTLRDEMEKDVAELLGYGELAETPEEEREREEEEPQPRVPGQREEGLFVDYWTNKLKKEKNEIYQGELIEVEENG